MNILPLDSSAPDFAATALSGKALVLTEALQKSPVLLCFALPQIHASRLVVGYLRRLKANVPDAEVWIILQGKETDVRSYAEGYLDSLEVIADRELNISKLYKVSHVPSTYYLSSEEAKIALAFTGFNRPALNKLANLAAEATGAKAKELISAMDNKGDYELAEKALSAD